MWFRRACAANPWRGGVVFVEGIYQPGAASRGAAVLDLLEQVDPVREVVNRWYRTS